MLQAALPLGKLLVASGLLSQQALDEVLVLQKSDGRRLGELLAEKGLVRPHQLAQFLSHQLACPWVSLQRIEVTREAVDILPRDIALKHHMVPVHLRTSAGATALYVAMDDPTDDIALSEAAKAATMPVKPMVALSSEIRTLLDRLYLGGKGGSEPPSSDLVRTASMPAASITMKTEKAGTIPPRAIPTRPPKPPPPMKVSGPPPPRDEPSVLDEIEMIEDAPASQPRPVAKILLVEPAAGARNEFIARSKKAAAKLGAETNLVSLAAAAKTTTDQTPCAVIVAEEMYETDRSGLDRLALEAGAQLIIASSALPDQVEQLLEGAIKRWRLASYDKGTVLEGRYELLRDLGGRLPGSRWEVRHLRTARRSMLKVGVRATNDESDAEAVRREHLALAKFQHPGAVDLRDAGTTHFGDPYVIVEMLEGRTLEGLVAARGALAMTEACALVRQVADALVAAHDAGVLHHAVRAENVLVVRDPWGTERVKLVHWEAATIAEGPIETAVDLAGLGALSFLALVGRSRNAGEDVTTSGLPEGVATIIGRAIGGAAGARFANAKEFVDALESAAPRKSDVMQLLDAKPERRVSLKPEAKLLTPIPKVSEMRRFARAPYRTPVRVEVPGIGAVDGRSEDISEGGLFVVTRGKIADGATVTVRFALPIDGKVVSESGIVRWSRTSRSSEGEPRAIGIELASLGAESTRQIARYVSFMSNESK